MEILEVWFLDQLNRYRQGFSGPIATCLPLDFDKPNLSVRVSNSRFGHVSLSYLSIPALKSQVSRLLR